MDQKAFDKKLNGIIDQLNELLKSKDGKQVGQINMLGRQITQHSAQRMVQLIRKGNSKHGK